MGQAGEMARHFAHPHPAAILVVREVPHGVQAVLDVPAVADQRRQLRGRADPATV